MPVRKRMRWSVSDNEASLIPSKQRKRAERKVGLKPPRLHCSSQKRSTRLPGSHQATVACWGNSVSARNALALTPLPHSVMAWGEWGLGSNSGMDLKIQLLSLSVSYAPCNWQSEKQILMATKIPTRKREIDVWFICDCSLCSIYPSFSEMKQLLFLVCINRNQVMGNRNIARSRFYMRTSRNLTSHVKKFILATSPTFSRSVQCHPQKRKFWQVGNQSGNG